jgi:hypothetical protein
MTGQKRNIDAASDLLCPLHTEAASSDHICCSMISLGFLKEVEKTYFFSRRELLKSYTVYSFRICNVKLSMYLTKHHSMKTYWGVEV